MNKMIKAIGIVLLAMTFVIAMSCGNSSTGDPSSPGDPYDSSLPTLTYTGSTLSDGKVGQSYSVNIGTAALPENAEPVSISYALASGSLPAGLTLSSGGLLSGSPTAAGTKTFSIRASAEGCNSTTASFTMTIAASGGSEGDLSGYKIFTSIADLRFWLATQKDPAVIYQVALKDVDLDEGNNWGELGVAINAANYVDLNLQGCTGTAIPDGHMEYQGSFTFAYYGVFAGSNLWAITFPEELKSIGMYAFYGCTKLHEVTFPDGLTDINDNAFHFCTALESVKIPAKVKNIADGTFYGCNWLSSAEMPNVENIGSSAFYNCKHLETVQMPNVENINQYAFQSTSLTTFEIPNAVNIGDSAFQNCTVLTSVKMLNVKNIGENAFNGCIKLSSVEMPIVESIGVGAFGSCTGLVNVEIPIAENIGSSAFSGCKALVNVKASIVGSISYSAFSGCSALANVEARNVESIGYGAFLNCSTLTSVEFPQVKNIDNCAFGGCTALTTVIIPSITSINTEPTPNKGAFYDCPKLAVITMSGTPPSFLPDYLNTSNAFRGSTPDNFTIRRPAASAALYINWVSKNYNHFNNNGKNIKFEDSD